MLRKTFDLEFIFKIVVGAILYPKLFGNFQSIFEEVFLINVIAESRAALLPKSYKTELKNTNE